VEYLQSGHFSIEEVAYTLGYSDLANFRRAFKRWESVPPSEFRATQRESRTSGTKAPHATRKPPSRQPHSRRRE
jgi:AraC-like DNA-binding protein